MIIDGTNYFNVECISSKGEMLNLSGEHDLGDVCLFKYSLKHWVMPTDPDSVISNDNDGRWSLVVPIY